MPVQRRMNLTELVEARAGLPERIELVRHLHQGVRATAAQTPELRRAYLSFPWARLYEHPHSIASVAIERLYQGENAVLFAHLTAPETKTLQTLDARLRQYKSDPIESLVLFRNALAIGRLPGWLRRPFWWGVLNGSGHWRARVAGTFGVSVYSALGAESLHPLSPLTSTLHYGVIAADGTVPVRVTYDHRVMDGSTIARALALMEDVLHQDLLTELRGGDAGRAA